MLKRRTNRFLILGAAVVAISAGGVGVGIAQAAPAAGTLSVDGGTVTFKAGNNVSNNVESASTRDLFFFLEDKAAPIRMDKSTAGRCTRIDASGVRCSGITALKVELGDGNDALAVNGFAALTAHGGAGNDTLNAAYYESPVKFYGDFGNDTLIGGDADDDLDAGPGTGPQRNQRTEGGTGADYCAGSFLVKVSCEVTDPRTR